MKPGPALLHELARAHGVQTSFITMSGERNEARSEALAAVLDALEVPARNEREIRESLSECAASLCSRCIEPVVVAWDNQPARVRIHLTTRSSHSTVRGAVHLEDGSTKPLGKAATPCPIGEIQVQSGRQRITVLELRLPPLPFGFHELELQIGRRLLESFIISAPARNYSSGAQQPGWGVFLPMYAAHSSQSWGAGNLSDWEKLCQWTAAHGGSIAATLPLLATFLDHPRCEPSPYSPASRLFWNEFYIDVTAIPEFQKSSAAKELVASLQFQKQVERFRKSRLVDYAAEWQLRRKVLEVLAGEFFDARSPRRRADFECFLRSRPEVEDYARFRAACDAAGQSWHLWPKRQKGGDLRDGDLDDRARRFHLYVQWIAQDQIDRVIAGCRRSGVQFYLDLPLGVHPDGYDVWRERESFALKASAGAPPDSFFTLGQNWGFAPLHPQRIREQRYRYVRDYLRFQMRHTGLLRIDHVMGLHRLYWIPQGFEAGEGVYVSYAAEEMHALLNLESHQHKTVIVGENLGTVPPEVNEAMDRHGMRGMYVVQYQQRPDPRAALEPPHRRTVASLNTHDLPTFAAHWKGLEILDHAKLGLVKKDEIKPRQANRRRMNEALGAFLKSQRLLRGSANLETVIEAALVWLAHSPAEIVLVNLEDLLLEEQPQNMPGTYTERPNWRRKARLMLEEIMADPRLSQKLRRIANARRRT